MFNASPLYSGDFRTYFVWLASLLLVAFGFRYLKDILVFVLEKLYEIFIQQTPTGV